MPNSRLSNQRATHRKRVLLRVTIAVLLPCAIVTLIYSVGGLSIFTGGHHSDVYERVPKHEEPSVLKEGITSVLGNEKGEREGVPLAKPEKPKNSFDNKREIYNLKNRVERTGQRVFTAKALRQLHHGIYRVDSSASGMLLSFAFKTECRPPQKWHGQQGWGEIAVHQFMHEINMFSMAHETKDRNYVTNTVPFSTGGVVFITKEMQKSIIHSDQCGLMNSTDQEHMLATLEDIDSSMDTNNRPRASFDNLNEFKRLRMLNSNNGNATSEGLVPFVGVFLTWMEGHDDGALPSKNWAKYYLTSNKGALSDIEQSKESIERVKQSSDIMLFDFILGNEDREDKNWFREYKSMRDASILTNPFIMMDNGWVFSGRMYQQSMCSRYVPLLLCPSLLRRITSSSTCGIPKSQMSDEKPFDEHSIIKSKYAFCRFNPVTISLIDSFSALWGDTNSSITKSLISYKWIQNLKNDVLINFLLRAFRKATTREYDMSLARYTGKPCWDVHDTIRVIGSTGALATQSDIMQHEGLPSKKKTSEISLIPLVQLATGINVRLKLVKERFLQCQKALGVTYSAIG